MVLALILMVCLVLLFARRVWRLDLFLPARRIQNGLCAESATAGHGFLDSGIVLCVFAWKPLAGLRSVALLSAMGTNATVFL
jgi:hypothetical protein